LKDKQKLEQRNKKQKGQYKKKKKDLKLQVNDQENKDIAHNKKNENKEVKKIEKKALKMNPNPIGDKEKCSRLGLVLNKLKDILSFIWK